MVGQPPVGTDVTYIYVPYVDEQGTGMQRFCSEMVPALIRAGVDARVLIGEVGGRPPWLDRIPHRIIIGAVARRLLPQPVTAVLRLLWIQFVLPLVAKRGATLLALVDRDVAILPLMRQIAVAHDLTQVKLYRQRRGIARDLRNWLWKAGLKWSSQVIAISEAAKKDLIETFQLPASHIHVVYEGFDPATFKATGGPAGTGRPYLLYAGTLSPNKNIPFLLEVYVALRRDFDLELRLVGKQEAAQVSALLASVPADTHEGIDFRGFVSDSQLAALMQGCAAFVFPSLSEGFGLAPVEAMACGAATISSDAGSLAEVVGAGGVLLPPTEIDRWVAELAHVLTDEGYRSELSRRALKRSADYSWDRAARAYQLLLADAQRS